METDTRDDVVMSEGSDAHGLDEEPDPAAIDDDDDDDADTDDSDIFIGPVRGGPWDGRTARSRYPRGFLLIDKPARAVWIYDRSDDGTFYVRGDRPLALDDEKRWKAADGGEFDILVPGAEMSAS